MQTKNLPGLCHTESSRNNKRGIAIFREVLQGSAESDSSAANNCFTATVDASEGSEVKCAKEVVTFLEVAGKLGEQEVGCERDFDRLSGDQTSQKCEALNNINYEPSLRSSEGIAGDRRGWRTRGRATAKHQIEAV